MNEEMEVDEKVPKSSSNKNSKKKKGGVAKKKPKGRVARHNRQKKK